MWCEGKYLFLCLCLVLPSSSYAARRGDTSGEPAQADGRRSEPAANTDGQQEQAQDDEAQVQVTETMLKMYQASTSATCLGTGTHLKKCKWGLFTWLPGIQQCTITECATGEYCFTPCLGQTQAAGEFASGECLGTVIEQAQCLKPDLVLDTSCAGAGATKTTVVVKQVKADVLQPCAATMPYCQNGACVPANQVTCLDIEGEASSVVPPTDVTALQAWIASAAKDPAQIEPSVSVGGTVTSGGATYNDKCKGSAFLLEQACNAKLQPIEIGVPCAALPGGQCVLPPAGGAFCAQDQDKDGVYDATDNCRLLANPEQQDTNGNGFGDICDYPDDTPACPVAHVLQGDELAPADLNKNGIFDSCEYPLLVTANSNGAPSDNHFTLMDINADGRFVAYVTEANDIVPGNMGGVENVFLYDRLTQQSEQITVGVSGEKPNVGSTIYGPGGKFIATQASISADGQFVFFHSKATNLVGGDTTEMQKLFVRDRVLGVTATLLPPAYGVHSQTLFEVSNDARFVLFRSKSPTVPVGVSALAKSHVYDRLTGSLEAIDYVSLLNPPSPPYVDAARLSGDGNMVLLRDGYLYVYDRSTKTTTPILWVDGVTPVDILHYNGFGVSADGQVVSFAKFDPNFLPYNIPKEEVGNNCYVYDAEAQQTVLLPVDGPGAQDDFECSDTDLSGDGRYLVYAKDNHPILKFNEPLSDCFVHDRVTGDTAPVSVLMNGQKDNALPLINGHIPLYYGPRISHDGRFIAFVAHAEPYVVNAIRRIYLTVNPLWQPPAPTP